MEKRGVPAGLKPIGRLVVQQTSIHDRMNKFLYLLIAFLILQRAGFSQTIAPELATTLQAKLDSMKTAHNIRGISASLLLPGQGSWQGVAGISHIGVPITKDMAFGIGSNTKLFTAVTLLKLVENGLIGLQDSLHEWLPAYANINPNITIRQLLNHTSGIKDITEYPGFRDSIQADPNRVLTPQTLMTWVGPPLFAPGTGWSYSNTNYILTGMIIEAATGQKFGKILRNSILSPLQMDSTFLSVEEKAVGSIAHPWQNGLDTYATPRTSQNSATWAAGGLYSTSGEMAQWYDALMNGRVLGAHAFAEMTAFVGPAAYGFGISRQTLGGRGVFGHSGVVPGYTSFCAYDTLSGAVVCVLINATPSVQPRLVAEALLSAAVNSPLSATHDAVAEHNIAVFPNPSNGSFRLVFPEKRQPKFPLQVSVADINGRILFHQIVQNKEDTIKVEHLQKGLYLIRAGDFAGRVVLGF